MKQLALLLPLVLLLVGCSPRGFSPDAAAPAPPAASKSPAVVTPAPKQAIQSGGLGLSLADWNTKYGKPGKDNSGFIDYGDGKYTVVFMDNALWHLERHWGDKGALAIDVARGESKSLLPADAEFVRTYTAKGDRTVDLYSSKWLAGRFGPGFEWSGDADPGSCIVLYRTDAAGRVFTILLATGNNP